MRFCAIDKADAGKHGGNLGREFIAPKIEILRQVATEQSDQCLSTSLKVDSVDVERARADFCFGPVAGFNAGAIVEGSVGGGVPQVRQRSRNGEAAFDVLVVELIATGAAFQAVAQLRNDS